MSNNEADWLDYKITRSEVKMELRKAKKEYYSSNIAAQNFNPKKAFKKIDNIFGKKYIATVLNEITFENRNLTSLEDTAEGITHNFQILA